MNPILCQHNPKRSRFSLPNDIWKWGLKPQGFSILAYLLYCEDRRTHQCHPSYRTISAAVHLAMSTVIKHIAKLVDKQFITVENTTYIDKHGMKWNGNNQYTILPIQAAMDYCYQQQMLRLEKQALMHQQAKNTP